jgi:hypothetical protein
MDVLALSSKLMKGFVKKPEMRNKRVVRYRAFRVWAKITDDAKLMARRTVTIEVGLCRLNQVDP